MAKLTRQAALERIRDNIARHGHHVYTISGGGPLPRYVYTVGLSERIGAELILAGAIFFMADDTRRIINTIATDWASGKKSYAIDSLGRFSLRKADFSWTSGLMLGAVDYYGNTSINAWQVVPEPACWTLDIPDMCKPWSADEEPVWQWMRVPWTLSVPSSSNAVTDLAALRGGRVTEAARWEEDEWELFSGDSSNLPEEEARIVPLGTLLSVDSSLIPIVTLPVGSALIRDSDEGEWEQWGSDSRPAD